MRLNQRRNQPVLWYGCGWEVWKMRHQRDHNPVINLLKNLQWFIGNLHDILANVLDLWRTGSFKIIIIFTKPQRYWVLMLALCQAVYLSVYSATTLENRTDITPILQMRNWSLGSLQSLAQGQPPRIQWSQGSKKGLSLISKHLLLNTTLFCFSYWDIY